MRLYILIVSRNHLEDYQSYTTVYMHKVDCSSRVVILKCEQPKRIYKVTSNALYVSYMSMKINVSMYINTCLNCFVNKLS